MSTFSGFPLSPATSRLLPWNSLSTCLHCETSCRKAACFFLFPSNASRTLFSTKVTLTVYTHISIGTQNTEGINTHWFISNRELSKIMLYRTHFKCNFPPLPAPTSMFLLKENDLTLLIANLSPRTKRTYFPFEVHQYRQQFWKKHM